MRSRPRRPPCAIATIRTARGCRSSSTPPPTASSRRFRSTPVHHHARQLALEAATANAQAAEPRAASFLVSACGAATTLLAMNAAYAARRSAGRLFRAAAGSRARSAARALDARRREFIFDVQGHFVNPTGAWTKRAAAGRAAAEDLRAEPRAAPPRRSRDSPTCNASAPTSSSRTSSWIPTPTSSCCRSCPRPAKGEPLTIEEAAATARIVEQLDGTHRLLLHGRVNPNQPGDLDGMDVLGRALPDRGVEDLYAMGSRRQGLLPGRRSRPRADREGAQARRSGTSPSTRACRSARGRTSTRPASTSAASRSASRT